MTKTLLSFHNDPKVKAKYIKRVKAHVKADALIQNYAYWEGGKGCAVGCTLHSGDHAAFETELGVPEWIEHCEDEMFEGMSAERSKTFPLEFLEAIPIAVSGRMATKLKVDRATVMISTDVVNAKQAKHKTEKFNLEIKHFSYVQQILDEGKIVYDGRYKNHSVFGEIGKDWFKAVENVSAAGFMRIQTFHPISKGDMEKFIKRREGKKG